MKKDKKTYWPHMILGFLVLGVTLSYWTVKSASSIPVQESNEYMMKYQQADITINEILQKKAAFDKVYKIVLQNAAYEKVALENAKRAKEERAVVLRKGENRFEYLVSDHEGHKLNDANVTFLLTRPHTTDDDILRENLPNVNGMYIIDDLNITKPGRYILQLKVEADKNRVGYSEIPANLKR